MALARAPGSQVSRDGHALWEDPGKKLTIEKALPHALAAVLRGLLDARCVREDDFSELFRVIGNRQMQDEIRAGNPGGNHCRLLINNPEACLQCPAPENPYRGSDALAVRLAHANYLTVGAALDLYHRHRIGMLSGDDIGALSPAEAVMLRLVLESKEAQMVRLQSELMGIHVGRELAEVMQAMFGKK